MCNISKCQTLEWPSQISKNLNSGTDFFVFSGQINSFCPDLPPRSWRLCGGGEPEKFTVKVHDGSLVCV